MIRQTYVNWVQPDAGGNVKPVSQGLVHIGKEGLDPLEGGEKIYYTDNQGIEKEISSPLQLNMTGVFVASKNDSTIINPYIKSSGYSIAVVDKNDKSIYENRFVDGGFKDNSLVTYRSSGSLSAVDNMLKGEPVALSVGEIGMCENGTIFRKISDGDEITNYQSLTSINLRDFAKGDGVTDDSESVQMALDLGGSILGNPEDTYFINECYVKKYTEFDGRGCTFKYKRAAGDSAPWLPAQRLYTWTDKNGEHTTGQETMIEIKYNGFWKNFYVDGNGVPYRDSADYPNAMMSVFWIEATEGVIFDNVHILENNANAVTAYKCKNFQYINGSVLNTHGLTGSITNQEQITILSSQSCRVANNLVGGYNPWSAISTLGGLSPIKDGTEIGGWYTYNNTENNSDPELGVKNFGREVGDTDGFHIIEGNTVLSVPNAQEAGGGGVIGRNITVNSPQCVVRNNFLYNTAETAQAGIGLGHEYMSIDGKYRPSISASRTEVYGNVVAGYENEENGYGIGNFGSESCNVHDNFVYNCHRGIAHTRFSTCSVYDRNQIHFCKNGAVIGGVQTAGGNNSHGIDKRVQFTFNHFIENDKHIVYEDNSGWFDGVINHNKFRDTKISSNVMIYLNHGYLEFNHNHIITSSKADGIVTFYAQNTDSHTDMKDNRILCSTTPDSDNQEVVKFDGVQSPLEGGRGSLSINGLTIESPNNDQDYNRRVQIQRETPKGLKLSGFNMKNVYASISDLRGDVIVSDGKIETIGTALGLIGEVKSTDKVTFFKIDNVTFPAVGGDHPIDVNVVSGAGFNVITNCLTLEDKNISADSVNEARYALANNFKIKNGALTPAQS